MFRCSLCPNILFRALSTAQQHYKEKHGNKQPKVSCWLKMTGNSDCFMYLYTYLYKTMATNHVIYAGFSNSKLTDASRTETPHAVQMCRVSAVFPDSPGLHPAPKNTCRQITSRIFRVRHVSIVMKCILVFMFL